jgi:hypothetical protein
VQKFLTTKKYAIKCFLPILTPSDTVPFRRGNQANQNFACPSKNILRIYKNTWTYVGFLSLLSPHCSALCSVTYNISWGSFHMCTHRACSLQLLYFYIYTITHMYYNLFHHQFQLMNTDMITNCFLLYMMLQ